MSLKEEATKKKWYWITPLILAILVGGSWVYLTPTEKYDVCRVGSIYGEWVNTTETFYINDKLSALGKYRCELENKEMWCGRTTKTRCYYIFEETYPDFIANPYSMPLQPSISIDSYVNLEYSGYTLNMSNKEFWITLKPYISYDNKEYDFGAISNNFPGLYRNILIYNEKYRWNYVITLDNISYSLLNKIDTIKLKVDKYEGLTPDEIDVVDSSIIIKDKIVLGFDDLTDNKFEVSLNKSEVVITNISDKIVDNFLFMDPTVSVIAGYSTAFMSIEENVVVACTYKDGNGECIMYWTNGTIKKDWWEYDSTYDSANQQEISLINSTAWAIAWEDAGTGRFQRHTMDGTAIGSATIFDTGATTESDIGIGGSGDEFIVCWADAGDDDANMEVWYADGTIRVSERNLDSTIGVASQRNNLIDCTSNGTLFFIVWFDDYSSTNDASYGIRDKDGGYHGTADFDTDVGETGQVAVATIDNDKFAAIVYDSTDDDVDLYVHWTNDSYPYTSICTVAIDETAGSDSRVDISAIEASEGADDDILVAWRDDDTGNDMVAVYYSNCSVRTTAFSVNNDMNNVNKQIHVTSHDPIVGGSLCAGHFAVLFSNSSTEAFSTYYINGTAWDGECPVESAPDINFTWGPDDTSLVRLGICGPDFENATAEPENQTSSKGIYYLCNNGTATGDLQIKWSGTSATNWTLYASNTSISASLITETTSYTTIYDDLAQDDCTYVWLKANCSYTGNPPGVYELFQIV